MNDAGKVFSFWRTILITLMLIFFGSIAGNILAKIIETIAGSSPFWETFCFYMDFSGIWLVTVLFLYFSQKNRPILRTVGTGEKGNTIPMFVLGLLIGFGMNMICVAAALLHGDIHLYFHAFHPAGFLALFLVVFIQSSAEELVCRGFLYRRLRAEFRNPAVAVVGNAVLFAALHLGNDGLTVLAIINIIVVGILFSLMVYYFDSIWCAMAAHTAWNFNQNIVFGLPNSGVVLPESVMKLDAGTATDSFVYHVGFGVEGTLFACGLICLGCLIIWLIGRKKEGPAKMEQKNE